MQYASSLNFGSYFFGSIILEHNTGYENSRSIIDGQQRITTFSLFLKAFSLIIKDEETRNSINQTIYYIGTKEPILTPSDNDSEDFFKCMKHQSTDQLNGDSQIIKCFNYFLKNINTNEVDLKKIFSHISLI